MNDFNPAIYNWAPCVPEILVSDFDASLTFYKRLGFVVMYERDDFVYMEFQSAQFMISQRNNWWETGLMEQPYGRGINFQFSCDDVDALIAICNQAGIPLYEEKKEKWRDLNGYQGGSIEFLIQDPDGYLLRFLENKGYKK